MAERRAASRHLVGTLVEFPLDQVRIFELAGRSIGVVRTPTGVYAVRNLCPHQAAPICLGHFGGTMLPSGPAASDLQYGLEHRVIRCPWHLWEFDIATGEALFGISTRRLVTYPVEVEQDCVYVLVRAAN